MNKKWIWFLLFTFMFSIFPFAASADIHMEDTDAEKVNSQIVQELTLDATEIQVEDLQSALRESPITASLLGDTTDKSVSASPILYDQNYCQFYFTEPEIISEYQKKGSLSDIISTDYKLCIPLNTGGEICMDKTDETWKVVGMSEPISEDSHTSAFSIGAVSRHLQQSYKNKSLTGTSAVISDLKVVRSHMYYITFVYYTNNGKEYVIPYSDRPDFTGLEDGKTYLASDAMRILGENFAVGQNADVGADAGVGGAANSDVNTQQTLHWLIVLAFSVLILGGAVALLLVKKKKSFER